MMHFRRLIALLSCVAFTHAAGLAGWTTVAWAKEKAYIQVLSLTKGAEILVDDELVGTVPFDDYIPVSEGKHSVVVRLRGYAEYHQEVRVKAGQTAELIIDLIAVDGVLRVNTPGITDAAVTVDGQTIGFTPFDGLVAAGNHTLEVGAVGHRTFSQPLTVRAGESYDIDVDLQRLHGRRAGGVAGGVDGAGGTGASQAGATDDQAATALPVTTVDTVAGDSTPVHKTWWFWTLIGVGVAGTATALALTLGDDSGGTSGATGPGWTADLPELEPGYRF